MVGKGRRFLPLSLSLRLSFPKKATRKKRNRKVDEILESGLHGTIFCCKLFLLSTLYVAKQIPVVYTPSRIIFLVILVTRLIVSIFPFICPFYLLSRYFSFLVIYLTPYKNLSLIPLRVYMRVYLFFFFFRGVGNNELETL